VTKTTAVFKSITITKMIWMATAKLQRKILLKLSRASTSMCSLTFRVRVMLS